MSLLKKIYMEHKGKSSDKWDIYISVYEEILLNQRLSIFNLLEIGVQNGGSLEIWSKYFENAKNIIGCDINPNCEKLEYENPAIKVIIGDSSNDVVKDKITSISASFNLIIDDGSHNSSDIIKSFFLYFPLIEDDGLYIIEDLHASYWDGFDGGLYYPYSSMAFLKKLADITNHEHWGTDLSPAEFLNPFSDFYNCGPIDRVNYSTIHSVTFINSLCIIRKKKTESNLLGKRNIVGDEWKVAPGNKNLHRSNINKITQIHNKWSNLIIPPEMEWENLCLAQLADKKISDDLKNNYEMSLASLNEEIKRLQKEVESTRASAKTVLQENYALRNSRSWKITAPLRAFMTKMKSK